MKKEIQLAIAQINLCVGDIKRNTIQIIENIHRAKEKYHADIVIFPELAITAYPPEDLLLRPALHSQIKISLEDICNASHGIDVIISYPLLLEDKLYNSCSLIRGGEIKETYHKQLLPNYGVFDEKRYFEPGDEITIFDLQGIPTALSICEDIWEEGSCQKSKDAGAKLMININASPYHFGKDLIREKLLKIRAQESGLDIIYTNLVGGQDELVFDGGSMAVNSKGKTVFRAPQFEEGIYLVCYSETHKDRFSAPDNFVYKALSEKESIYKALVLGVKDYVYKNGFKGAIIGLSGGIDSALTLCIAVDALGADNVEVLIMPSQFTASMSNEDAQLQAEKLGVRFNIIPIGEAFAAFNNMLEPRFKHLPADTTEENIQARCRGILLMALSNKTGELVLTTGNKSEMSVGYSTLYGDMAGGFAPLKDIPKGMVFKLANWRNERQRIIPQRVIDRPPSAELRENQIDEDSLPPYEVLDPILERYIELDQSPAEIIESGFDAEIVKQIVSLIDRNEYKRRQAAPGVRISERAFGRDRRYPITSGYKEI
ncbi:MAG: NAD+ synthase [Gammaproteobacteria bacterium]